MKKSIGLIPTRIGSTRLPSKPLLEINGIPLVIHTYKRAKLSKKLDDVIICCDDKKILKVAKKINKTIFEFELEVNKKNIFIKLGIGEKRITKFKTKNILIISDDPYYIYMNQEKINHIIRIV